MVMFWWFLAGVLGLLVICCAGLLFGSRGRVGGSCRCGGPGGPSGRGRQGRQGRRSALSLFGFMLAKFLSVGRSLRNFGICLVLDFLQSSIFHVRGWSFGGLFSLIYIYTYMHTYMD